MILNSFGDLEGEAVEDMEALGLPKVYTLGPLPLVAREDTPTPRSSITILDGAGGRRTAAAIQDGALHHHHPRRCWTKMALFTITILDTEAAAPLEARKWRSSTSLPSLLSRPVTCGGFFFYTFCQGHL